MRLLDVNVLVNAHRRDATRHDEYRALVASIVDGEEPYAVSDFVITGFVRVATNLRSLPKPATLDEAVGFADQIRNQPRAVVINPGDRFWGIFTRLCRESGATGKLVPDAYLAALAIEHGCEFLTDDRDFAKFPGLRWRHPLN
ncbi:MAG: type II toxin-antitoxin system VapC family toxin [Actinomadura sp.]